jgi:hypothetical protein
MKMKHLLLQSKLRSYEAIDIKLPATYNTWRITGKHPRRHMMSFAESHTLHNKPGL